MGLKCQICPKSAHPPENYGDGKFVYLFAIGRAGNAYLIITEYNNCQNDSGVGIIVFANGNDS